MLVLLAPSKLAPFMVQNYRLALSRLVWIRLASVKLLLSKSPYFISALVNFALKKLQSFAITFYISQPDKFALSNDELLMLASLNIACFSVASLNMQLLRLAPANLTSIAWQFDRSQPRIFVKLRSR